MFNITKVLSFHYVYLKYFNYILKCVLQNFKRIKQKIENNNKLVALLYILKTNF